MVLAHLIGETCLFCARGVFRRAAARYQHHVSSRFGPYEAGDGVSVHPLQAKVDYHDVRPESLYHFQGIRPIEGEFNVVSHLP